MSTYYLRRPTHKGRPLVTRRPVQVRTTPDLEVAAKALSRLLEKAKNRNPNTTSK